MVLTMHVEGTSQSTSQALSVPVYVRKKELDPARKIECTCARMIGKSPDIQFRTWFLKKEMWNICQERGGYLRLTGYS